jgi:predicted methyltransferase
MISHLEKKKTRPFYRLRIFLFLVCALLAMFALDAASQAVRTFERLNIVERSRDRWQRPADILAPLNLKEGSKVAEIGSGAGYFALKLGPVVGKSGSVFAVDILKQSLLILWIRARLRNQTQLHVVLGDPDDPHLPVQGLDAVLIANAYRDFVNPKAMADHVYEALRPGGRLVVADRGPDPGGGALSAAESTEHHERSPEAVERELVAEGFELVNRQDGFIFISPLEHPGDRPELHPWWLIVVRRPY